MVRVPAKREVAAKKNKRVVSFDLIRLVVELLSLSCYVWLSNCLVRCVSFDLFHLLVELFSLSLYENVCG